MKKETILKSLMLVFMAISAANVCGQTTWVYSYDGNGNRTQRVVNTGAKARQRAASPNNLINDEKVSAAIDANRNNIKVEILSLKSSDEAEVAIYDLSGIQILSKRIESEITTLNLGKLRKGTYILSIVLNDETKSCKFNK